jgi:lauroyl-KDO2-lipid IV(A) myristoyltransferase
VPIIIKSQPRRKQIALTNISLCFPHLSEREKLELLYTNSRIFAHIFLNYGQLIVGTTPGFFKRFDVQGLENIHKETVKNKNIILMTSHTIAMEYIGQYIGRDHRYAALVRLHQDNELMDWVVTRYRNRNKAEMFNNDGNLLPMVRAVRSGSWLYFLPDEDRGEQHFVFAPFFGVQKLTTPSLSRFAELCNASVIPMMGSYSPTTRRYSIKYFAAIEDFPSGDVQKDATIMNQALEDMINQDPAQYMWTVKIFRTRPQGESGVY